MRSCENAIGLMKNLQLPLQVEESWVDGTTKELAEMPTATPAYELDVSYHCCLFYIIINFLSVYFVKFLVFLGFLGNFFIISKIKVSIFRYFNFKNEVYFIICNTNINLYSLIFSPKTTKLFR